MPYDSNGVATVTRNRAITGQTVQAAQVNVPFDDIQSMLSQVLLRSGVAPMTGPLNMNGFKLTNNAEGTASGDFVTLSQVQALVSDPWSFKAIGEPFMLDTSITGVSPPPKDKAYRYILLTAGESDSGEYNEGVLTGESVSGTAPNIVATAVVSLSGSPLNGRTVRLINTTREFYRAGNPGVSEASKIISHTHAVIDPLHAHPLNATVGSSGVGNAVNQAAPQANEIPTSRVTSTPVATGITIAATGSDETAPRSFGINFYMRIL